MSIFFYLVFALTLVQKTLSEVETPKESDKDGSIMLPDQNEKSSLSETTDFSTVITRNDEESKRVERSSAKTQKVESKIDSESDDFYEKEALESLRDFDDLDKEDRNSDDDSSDVDRIAKELDTDEITEVERSEDPELIDSEARLGEDNSESEIDNSERGSSEDIEDFGYNRRMMREPEPKIRKDKTLHDYSVYDTQSNLLPKSNFNFDQQLLAQYTTPFVPNQLLTQPYSPYIPPSNWFNGIPFKQYPTTLLNPYIFSDKSKEFKNYYDNLNPFVGLKPPLSYFNSNKFPNIKPLDYNILAGLSFPNDYSRTNFRSQYFHPGRFIQSSEEN